MSEHTPDTDFLDHYRGRCGDGCVFCAKGRERVQELAAELEATPRWCTRCTGPLEARQISGDGHIVCMACSTIETGYFAHEADIVAYIHDNWLRDPEDRWQTMGYLWTARKAKAEQP